MRSILACHQPAKHSPTQSPWLRIELRAVHVWPESGGEAWRRRGLDAAHRPGAPSARQSAGPQGPPAGRAA